MKKKKMQKKIYCFCQTLPRKYAAMISMAALLLICASPAYAVEDMWTVGREIITDVYSQIAGISTVLAGLMSAVAVLGCKFSGGRQQRVDQSWDWLKRIWIQAKVFCTVRRRTTSAASADGKTKSRPSASSVQNADAAAMWLISYGFILFCGAVFPLYFVCFCGGPVPVPPARYSGAYFQYAPRMREFYAAAVRNDRFLRLLRASAAGRQHWA